MAIQYQLPDGSFLIDDANDLEWQGVEGGYVLEGEAAAPVTTSGGSYFDPPTFAAALSPKGAKTPRWNWSGDLLSSDWNWFKRNLLFATPFDSGLVRDLKSGLILPKSSTAEITQPTGAVFDAAGEGFEATALDSHKVAFPVTLFCSVTRLGSPSVNATLFGVGYNSALSIPYLSYSVDYGSAATTFQVNLNDAGTFRAWATGYVVPLNTRVNAAVVFTTTERRLYINGALNNSDTVTYSSPNYTTTSPLYIGCQSGVSARNTNSHVHYGYIVKGAATAEQIAQVHRDPFGPMRPDIIKVMPMFKATAAAAAVTTPFPPFIQRVQHI